MSKKINKLKESIGTLKNDLDLLITKHDYLTFDTEEDVKKWFNSFPIESLYDSILMERKHIRLKPVIGDFKKKRDLRNSYYKKKDQLDKILTEYNIETIDSILKKIEHINEI